MTLPDVFIWRSKQGEQASDDELMRHVRRGDPAAFRMIYDRYKTPIFVYCIRMLNDRDAAKDIVQEVFMRVHGMSRNYKTGTNFSGWLYTIARNLCLNVHRDTRNYVSFDETIVYAQQIEQSLPAEPNIELEEQLAREIKRLPGIYRETLILREYQGKKYEEIATILGITLATVKFRLFRAREILRERLSSHLASGE